MKISLYLLLILALILQPSLGAASNAFARGESKGFQAPNDTILYVKPVPTGTGDCTSWADSCTLQKVLSIAEPGDEIWVAQGVYKPTEGISYASCQEIRDANPAAPNGEYLIDINGHGIQIYCSDMEGTPKEYLTLDESNYSQYTAGGAAPGTDVHTTYTRVRLLPATLQVDVRDQTFSASSGSLTHGPTTVTSMCYGVAMDCRATNSSTGVARIDLRGTPFAVSIGETFIGCGYIPGGAATFSYENQVVEITGGGYCGSRQPAPTCLEPPWNESPIPSPILELDFYRPDRRAAFHLRNGVALYGGFDPDSGIDTFGERDPAAYPTVLSGDIDGDDVTDPIGVVTDTANLNGYNSYHVVVSEGVTETAVLDGFTITAGQANDYSNALGGGLINLGSPTLTQLTFSGNNAILGGGIYNDGSMLEINSSTFIGNGGDSGGGIYNDDDGIITLISSTVGPGNNVGSMGGGVMNQGEMVIINSTVVGNSGTGSIGGAGIASYGTLVITNTTISNNFTNVDGGGIYFGWGSLTLTNTTIAANIADYNHDGSGHGAAIFVNSSDTEINVFNTILADNLNANSQTGENCAGSTPNILYEDYNLTDDGTCPHFGSHTLSNTVAHLGPLADNGGPTLTHALRTGSPAIDAGSCPSFMADQRGLPRPVDIPVFPNADDGCDMGAFEIQEVNILYVKPISTGTGDCTSWANACELQTALNVLVPVDEIWVAEGVYKPTTSIDRLATFSLVSGVAVYGGFEGIENSRSQRDWETHSTVLSGDIGVLGDNSDNSYHVVTSQVSVANAVLDGFTITGGRADGSYPHNNGGGLYNRGNPTLTHLSFTDNYAQNGAGMYNYLGTISVNASSFIGNNPLEYGGGIYNGGTISVTNSTFKDNHTNRGAGIYSYGTLDVSNSTFSGNHADHPGGGIYNDGGTLSILESTFSGNRGTSGGGIFNYSGGTTTITNTILANSPSGGNCANSGGVIIDGGYNLDSANTCGFTAIGSLINTDPLLAPLADNGGPTHTHALLDGSPAIDAGSCPGIPTDQRGFPRPVDILALLNADDGCDIGAFEVQNILYLPIILK